MQKKQGIGWQRIVRKEGVMKSTDDSPSFWDIRRCLLSSVDFAEDFSLNHPEHTDAVTRFLQEIRRITKELTSSCEEGSAPSSLSDIVVGRSGARGMASIMAKRHPEKSGLLTRFEEGLTHAREEFIRNVRPEVYRQT